MQTYIVTRKSDGVEVYRYTAETPEEWIGYEFSTHTHTEFIPQAAEPTPTGPRRLTKLEFVGRMDPQEFLGLLSLSKTNVEVEAFMRLLDWTTPDPDGTSIDLDDPRTIAGVRAMFPPHRADEILGVS